MTDEARDSESQEESDQKTEPQSETASSEEVTVEALKQSLLEANDKYIRLYADFENYRKLAAKQKEDLLKYANENLISDILTVADHLELALEHSANRKTAHSDALADGVDLTLKELRNVFEKHGVTVIEALGKQFNPALHHAMSQIESDDEPENAVLKEFRKGYMLRDRVLRAALVGVAIRKKEKSDMADSEAETDRDTAENQNNE